MVLGHTRGCFNSRLHIVAPQRSEHVANEPVATAKWGSRRPFLLIMSPTRSRKSYTRSAWVIVIVVRAHAGEPHLLIE
jgi:hypothetical protein